MQRSKLRHLRAERLAAKVWLVAVPVVLSACSGTQTSDPPSPPLPCDVDTVLQNNCRLCHSNPTKYGAPMPLVTYADLHATVPSDSIVPPAVPHPPVYQVVGTRIHDTASPMPQPPNPSLNAADTATLDAWIAKGAPAKATSDSCAANDAGPGGEAGTTELECTPDEILKSASPWAMPQALDDEYVCYGVELSLAAKRQVIGMEPQIDNHSIVHHMLLFQADTPLSPTPAPCSPGGGESWRIVYAWAPGAKAFTMPANVGFAEDSSTHYIVQIHYNNVRGLANQTDSSGIDLCSTDQLRPYDADVLAFGTTNIDVPAHAALDETCSYSMPTALPALHLFAAFPHMHQLGSLIETTEAMPDSGTPVNLGSQPDWNFQNQIWMPIEATVDHGDVVNTRCAWDNTTNSAVTFGPNTENEMCYSFTMYYPKITQSAWSWMAPAVLSDCTPMP